MTKKKTSTEPKKEDVKEETAESSEPQLYAILKRIKYKGSLLDKSEHEYIDPAEDPFAEDAPRRTMDHLPPEKVEYLVLKKVIAPIKK